MSGPFVFVLKGYPRLSETFIAEEILGLERRGFDIRIVALRRPTDDRIHDVHREIAAPVAYLPEYLHDAPLRVLAAWWRQRGTPGYRTAKRRFFADLRRDPTRNRVRRFGQALVLAQEMPADAAHLHAHFIHTPASVASYASLLSGLPWTCSAHAKDIWTSAEWDLAGKLEQARWTVTCTRAGRDRLDALSPIGRPVRLNHHGLALDRFRPLLLLRPRRDGADPTDPVRLLAVGRAVAKKGFDLLVEALARLPADRHWRLTHIGGGPDLQVLKARAEDRGVADRIVWCGALDQAAVLQHYRDADLFVLPCRITEDGDRDGLPNVLVEAQSQGLAVLSTEVGGVPELIENGVNGRLVPADDSAALAAVLDELITDPDGRRAMGRAGQARVTRHFDSAASLDALALFFRDGQSASDRQAAE
ncbi:MAG: glycosyltransferase family 4 protein [Janthinobacterium lividum]